MHSALLSHTLLQLFQYHYRFLATIQCFLLLLSYVICQGVPHVAAVVLAVLLSLVPRLYLPPHSRHPSCTESSLLRLLNGFIVSSSPFFHPGRTKVLTWERSGSLFVHWRMCSAVIGEACKVSIV